MRTLVWFRNDLRVHDNPALLHASNHGEVIGVFCICAPQWRSHDVGDRRVAFLLDSLHALATDLDDLGIPLRLLYEPFYEDLPTRLVNLITELNADALCFNREYPINEARRDAAVQRAAEADGVQVETFHAGVIMPPGSVVTNDGEPYTVFTPFKRRWLDRLQRDDLAPLNRPRKQRTPSNVESSRLPATVDCVSRDAVAEDWPAGSTAAQRALQTFLREHGPDYDAKRDYPALDTTSRLSPHLSVGSLSARQCLSAAVDANDGNLRRGDAGLLAWINELIWRDFYRHVTDAFPHVSRGHAFRREWDRLPWRHAPSELEAWKAGETGYPLVDAAMRQLKKTGWMHNRLRMVTAMFLSKHLLLDWRLGERFFMQQLVDGDFAANNGGWQWSASTGTDAAPYFRIFNPHTQAKRFDPEGTFIRRFVPELADAPNRALFDPDKHPTPGYPSPIVDHSSARQRALDTFKAVQSG